MFYNQLYGICKSMLLFLRRLQTYIRLLNFHIEYSFKANNFTFTHFLTSDSTILICNGPVRGVCVNTLSLQ